MLQVVRGRQATESSLGGQGVKAVLYRFGKINDLVQDTKHLWVHQKTCIA